MFQGYRLLSMKGRWRTLIAELLVVDRPVSPVSGKECGEMAGKKSRKTSAKQVSDSSGKRYRSGATKKKRVRRTKGTGPRNQQEDE